MSHSGSYELHSATLWQELVEHWCQCHCDIHIVSDSVSNEFPQLGASHPTESGRLLNPLTALGNCPCLENGTAMSLNADVHTVRCLRYTDRISGPVFVRASSSGWGPFQQLIDGGIDIQAVRLIVGGNGDTDGKISSPRVGRLLWYTGECVRGLGMVTV
ncbi:hypothetical protein Tco_1200868 [Tanacetum coccineum]